MKNGYSRTSASLLKLAKPNLSLGYNTQEKIFDVDLKDYTKGRHAVDLSLAPVCYFGSQPIYTAPVLTDFLKEMEKKVVSPPQKLRCGIARGAIFSVGNGNDFVGPCINVSARLQKLHSLSFCFSRRGLKPEVNNFIAKELMTAKTDIRGIGSGELVCVLKSEYLSLSEEEKQNFLSI